MFDENRLRVFATIAREGSVTAAATALHYAQSSVSHHLARLEAQPAQLALQRLDALEPIDRRRLWDGCAMGDGRQRPCHVVNGGATRFVDPFDAVS
jgi:hypothetical protein